jgi:myo-inositol-1(or 4)-monophosphatase
MALIAMLLSQLSHSERTALLNGVVHIAQGAADLLMLGWRKRFEVSHKGRVDLVTEFDQRSEEFIRTQLARQFGSIGVIAEEAGGSVTDGLLFYVDPLDGTTNFAHGHPVFSVSIGLTQGGTPVLGCVNAPALGAVWAGGDGISSTRNGEHVRVSAVETLSQSLVATGFPYDRAESDDNNLAEFVWIERSIVQGVRRLGSAAIDLCMVADGTYDAYWEQKLSPWDLAAGSAIVLGAMGVVTDYDGRPVDVRAGQLVASNTHVHQALLDALWEARQHAGLPTKRSPK